MSSLSQRPAFKPDPLAVLRFRDFRLLMLGRFPAQIGEMMVSVAIGWELYERTSDAFALGLVGLVQIIPVMLLSLPGGYLADRYPRRTITLITQMILVVCSLWLAYLSVTQGALWQIYFVLALIGTARAFNNPAEGALTPQVVPPEYYTVAATWSTSLWQLSAITGPAAGGLVLAITGGATAVYVVNAAAGMILVVALLLMRTKQKAESMTQEPPLESLKNGIRFVWNMKIILGAITLDMFAVLLGGATFLLPVFAKDILMVDSTGLGLLRTAPSVGALLMAITLARRPPIRQAGTVLLWAVAGFGVATIIFGLSTSFWLSLAMLALAGALDNISVVIRHVMVMTYTPDDMRGRVGAVNSVFIGASNELGGFESGVAAAILGPVGAVVFGGIGTILVVLGIAWAFPALRHLDQIQKNDTHEA